jgi:hypothetical protein
LFPIGLQYEETIVAQGYGDRQLQGTFAERYGG